MKTITDTAGVAATALVDRQRTNIIRLSAVKERVGLSRSSIYQKIEQGTFPVQIRIGPRAVGWLDTDIDDWIDRQIALSRSGGARDDC